MSVRASYIEIDLPVCSLTYGQSPCTASGTTKCFNTRGTCQDLENYAETTATLRLAQPTLNLSRDIDAIPNVSAIQYTPPKINLAEGIGARSVLTVTFKDHPSPDTGPSGDKYLADRGYDPYHRGTFWGKFRARYRFMRGRKMRWYTGEVDQALNTFEMREFVIDRIEGPDSGGSARIVAKDPLTLLDDKRARAPVVSRGSLASLLTDSATEVILNPPGIVGAEYNISTPYFLSVGGEEIVRVTGVNTGSDTLTIQRARFNTEAIEHDTQTRAQICLYYSAEQPNDIIEDLMTTYGNIDSSSILSANWKSEVDDFLDAPGIPALYTALITEPTSVRDLVNEISEQAALSLWWDDIRQTIQLQVLRFIPVPEIAITDDLIMRGTFSQKDQQEKRVSQAWIYFSQINPLESRTDPNNYREATVQTSSLSEVEYGTPSVKQIYSRWIPAGGFGVAASLTNIVLSRFSEPPRKFSFDLLRDSGVEDIFTPELGTAVAVESFSAQDDTGGAQRIACQITSVTASDSKWAIEAEEITRSDIERIQADSNVWPVVVSTNQTSFNLRTAFNSLYPADLVQEGDTIRCEIRSGVSIGGSSSFFGLVSKAAFDTGVWSSFPVGVNIEIQVFSQATIAGLGGRGGGGAVLSSPVRAAASNGRPGGLGFRARTAVSVTNDGVIGGGGGGGGGGAAFIFSETDPSPILIKVSAAAAAGGGGGAGRQAGRGGGASVVSSVANETAEATGNNATILLGGAQASAIARDTQFRLSGSVSATARSIGIGGKGGDLGQPGENGTASSLEGTGQQITNEGTSTGTGGAAGNAVDGDSLITWTTLGDIRGNRVG